MTARRTPVLDWLLALGVTAALAGSLEGIARLFEPPEPEVAEYLWDWRERWDGDFYTVSSDAVGWPPHEEFNGDGLRDRSHPLEKPEGTWRVVCLGDSVTLGAGIRPEEAYPQALQSLLDAAGRTVEVFNVALWGWSTRQQVIAYREIARAYRPDQVLLGVCLNDVPELQNNLTRPPRWLAWLHERSALVRRVVGARAREIASVEELLRDADAPKVREAYARFFAEVRTLRAEARRDGAELALLVFPFRLQLGEDAPPPRAQEEILGFCRAEGLRCLDLLPALHQAGAAAFVDYDHFSAEGASVVAREVLRSGWLPERVAPPEVAALADPRRTVGQLVEALRRDERESVRAGAARELGRRGAREAAPALFDALADAREAVRAESARALWKAGVASPEWTGRLVVALGSRDAYVRGFAAWTLGEIGPAAAEAVPALVRALEEDGAHGRGGAGAALAKMGPYAAGAVPALRRALRGDDARARWSAARTLGRIGPQAGDAVEDLAAALRDEDARVRTHAARALGRIGPAARPAIPALERAAGDGERSVRKEARVALRQLGGR